MKRSDNPDNLFRGVLGLGIIIILSLAVMFFFRAMEKARTNNFWVDETFGLEFSTRQATYKDLLTWGARGQGSAAPLDYIFIKAIDSGYQTYFKNSDHNIYYRINSIFWDFSGGVLIFLLFFVYFYRQTTNVPIVVMQLILICISIMLFYFKTETMDFAEQMRPYALWDSLFFVMLGLVMLRGVSKWLLLVGVLLALTSNGVLIQVPALAFSQFVLRTIDREKFSVILWETILIFLLPFLIGIYYALHVYGYSYIKSPIDYQNYLHQFNSFWISKWRIPLFSGFGILLTCWNRQWRGCTTVFLTILLLYCFSPFINKEILSKSFFFASRQYLYYDLVFPLFFLMLALVLPEYVNILFNGFIKRRASERVI